MAYLPVKLSVDSKLIDICAVPQIAIVGIGCVECVALLTLKQRTEP
jgi:hypothetical protein